MDSMQVVGGLKAEIKCEPGDDVEIGFSDIEDDDNTSNDDPFNDDDDNDPFNVDDDDNDDPFRSNEDNGLIFDQNKQLIQDGPRNTKDKVTLQMKEKLILNYTNEDSLDDGNKKKSKNRGKEENRTGEDLPKAKKTRIPSSFVADTEYTVEDDGKHRCNHCQFLTTTKRFVFHHIRYRHRVATTMYECPYCPVKSRTSLKSHIIHRHKPDSEVEWFRCAQCDHKSKTKNLLCKHLLSHLNPMQMMDRMKKCDQCPKMYKTISDLQHHKLFAHKKHLVKKTKCTECEYECISSTSLKRHKGLCHSDTANSNLIECPNCTYKTRNEIKFQEHLQRNHLEKSFQCEKCSYRTTSIQRLKLHLITHQEVMDEKDLKYRCDKCEYKTYRNYSFQVHKLNHLKPEEIQYFYCYHCKFKAKRKDNLKTHILRHFNQNEVAFRCFSCTFSTKKREKITAHISKHSKARKK